MKSVIALAGLIALASSLLCSAQEAKIATTLDPLLETLKRSGSFEFSSASLDDVAAAIKQNFNVNVVVQNHAFEEVGLNDVRISFRAEGISLRSALFSMLHQFDATFAVRWESIVLTTNAQAESFWRPGIYDVTDLLSVDRNNRVPKNNEEVHRKPAFANFDSLIELILITVAADTWSASSGPSSDCIGMTIGDTHLLVISQSESAHAEIERLLLGMQRKVAARKKQDTEQ